MSSKKLPPRAERREAARVSEKVSRAREQLFELSPGGRPEHPLTLSSASEVEVRATSTACPRCEGALRLVEHTAEVLGGRRLRVVRLRCAHCGTPRVLYFSLGGALPN